MPRTPEERAKIEALRAELIAQTTRFCERHLDIEIAALSVKLIDKMARKRTVPFLSGSPRVWAASVVYALAQINFLFDREAPVHTTADQIATFFGVSKTTASGKAKVIRDMFKLHEWDPDFSTEDVQSRNPFRGLVKVNGVIMPLSWLEIVKDAPQNDEDAKP